MLGFKIGLFYIGACGILYPFILTLLSANDKSNLLSKKVKRFFKISFILGVIFILAAIILFASC